MLRLPIFSRLSIVLSFNLLIEVATAVDGLLYPKLTVDDIVIYVIDEWSRPPEYT